MPGPLFLILSPLILGLIALFLRRWRKPSIAFGVGTIAFLIIGLAQISIDGGKGGLGLDSWTVLGRLLIITDPIRWTLLTTYIVMGLMFLFSFTFPQSTVLIPLGIALLSPLAAALMVRPFVFGAILLLTVAAGSALLIQGERPGSTLSSWRHLAIFALAPPLLLVAAWMLDSDQAQFLRVVPSLFAVAFVILLVGFPFNIWVAPTSSESDPLVLVIVLGLIQLVVLFFCISLLRSYPIILRNEQFSQFLRSSAMVTLLMASLLALTAPSLGKLVGYLLLIDLGLVIYALSLKTQEGLDLAIWLLLLRIVTLLLITTGLSLLRSLSGSRKIGAERFVGGIAAYRATGRYFPLAAIILIYGLLSLMGTPLTPGFPAKWSLISLAGEQSSTSAAIIIIGLTAGILSLIRWIIALWQPSETGQLRKASKNKAGSIIAISTLLFSIMIVISPEIIVELINRISVP